MYHAPVVWNIEFSDILAHTRHIAEAWDAGGLYQVGGFPGFRWAEWNGRYRDLVRQYIKGDPGLVPELATRLTGSSDLYQSSGRLPINSVNFITCCYVPHYSNHIVPTYLRWDKASCLT